MSLLKQRPYTGRSAGHGRGVVAQNRLPLLWESFGISVPTSTRPITRPSGVAPAGWPIPRLTMLRSSATEESAMKVREKEPEDQPWIETILNERWGGGGQVVIHGEIFVAPFLPPLVAGELEGLATFLIQRSNDIVLA
jgi:hypothetical protein